MYDQATILPFPLPASLPSLVSLKIVTHYVVVAGLELTADQAALKLTEILQR